MSLYDLKVGDRVQVFDQWSRTVPEGGWDGEVVKIGSKLITVKYHGATSVFRLDTGNLNSKDFPHHARVKTVEQAAEDLRRINALLRLRELGLQSTGYRLDVPTNTIEALIKVLEEATSVDSN